MPNLLSSMASRIQPTISTERLILRPFSQSDAPMVRAFAGTREIASTTLSIPHPYEEGMAEAWIGTHQALFELGEAVHFAMTLGATGELVGCIGLRIKPEMQHAEVGYWVAVPFWGQGFASEALRGVVAFGFETLGLHRVYAHHLTRNPASGRVMLHAGMQYEGRCRDHVLKDGVFEDIELYGLLVSDWIETMAEGDGSDRPAGADGVSE